MKLKPAKIKYLRQRFRRGFITTLASIVVFVTTYALIIPAITWEKMLICELEEHVHTDNCYNSKGELKCGKTEHKHTDACFDAPRALNPVYICGKTEHKHTESCYFGDGTLKCTIPEHTHTSACLFVNRIVLTPKLFLAGGSDTPVSFYGADPDTSGLLDLFRVNGNFSAVNDGKVAVDKSVFTVGDGLNNKFKVRLSALGQSYVKNIPADEVIHPDIVFVVDISSSMNTSEGLDIDPDTDGDQTRFAAVADCLNYAIGEMLKADPKSRIGIVAYSEVVMDGTVEQGFYESSSGSGHLYPYGGKGLYLPLDEYNILPNGDYITVTYDGVGYDERGNKKSSSANTSLNDTEQLGINTALTNKNGEHQEANKTRALHGTNTQMGLLGGLKMFSEAQDKTNREPVLILITDGEPRSANENIDGSSRKGNQNPYLRGNSGRRRSDLFSNQDYEVGYWTIRTAMYVKNQLTSLYSSENGAFFYTMGPGVNTLYGKTILDPSADNLEACSKETSTGGDFNARDLYNALINGQSAQSGYAALPALTEEERKYSDFADWSLSGNLTPQELEEGMSIIIANMKKIPRPIDAAHSETHYSIIDTGTYLTFTDTVGKDMELTGTPQLVYGDKTFTAAVRETGILGSDSKYTSEYAGQPYTLYHFESESTVRETSTNKSLDITKVLLYEIEAEDGSTVIMWQFPDELLPVIYHNPGTDAVSGTSDDEFIPTDPLRIEFVVEPADENLTPGKTYYSNSTEDPTTATFRIAEDNPYYNDISGTVENPVYTPKNRDSVTAKSDNTTDTKPNSSEYDQNGIDGLDMDVGLGNNGKLFTPLYLDVFKVWEGAETHPDSITVYLYANGENTGQYVTLNADNEWNDRFEDLAVNDATGKKIVYTVREEVPEGYTVTGEEIAPHWVTVTISEPTVTPSEQWRTVTGGLESGKIYRIHFGDSVTDKVLFGNSSTLSVKDPSDNTTTEGEQWLAETSSGGLRLKNVASGKYLTISSNSLSYQSSSNSTTVSIPSGYNLIRLTEGSSRYYLKNNNGTVTAVTGHNNGSTVTVEELVQGTLIQETVTQTVLAAAAAPTWEAATSFEEGGIYRIRVGSATGSVLRDSSSQLTVGTASATTTDEAEQWTIVNGRLKNKKTGIYILFDSWNHGDATYRFTEFDQGTDQYVSPSYVSSSSNLPGNSLYVSVWGGRFLVYSNNTFSWIDYNNNANSITKYYLEKLVEGQAPPGPVEPEEPDEPDEPDEPGDIEEKELTGYGFALTNKPLELTVNAEKYWGDGTAGLERSVTLTVYEKTSDGTVSVKGTMTLNSVNDWKSEFTLSPASSSSTYYVAETGADDFAVSYSGGDIENVTYGGNTFRAVKVDVQHGANITVTNSAYGDELPETGGSGTYLLYVFSASIMFGAMTIGHILWRRREGRGDE